MSATYHGSLSLGGCFPAVVPILVAAQADLAAALAGQLRVQTALSVTLPTLNVAVAAATKVQAQLTAQLALGAPGVTIQLNLIAALIAALQLRIGVLVALINLLGAGVHLYSYTGRADRMGPDLSGILGAGPPGALPSDQTAAVLIAATVPASIAALAQFTGLTL